VVKVLLEDCIIELDAINTTSVLDPAGYGVLEGARAIIQKYRKERKL